MTLIKKHIICSFAFSMFFCFIGFAQKKTANELMIEMYQSVYINTKDAYHLLDSLDKLENKKNINYIYYYELKGLVHRKDHNYIEEYTAYNDGIKYAKLKGENLMVGLFNLYLGDLFVDIKDFEKSIKFYDKAEKIFIEEKETDFLLDLYQWKAYDLITDNPDAKEEEFQKSTKELLKNYNAFQKSKNPMLIMNADFMLVSNYLELNDKKNADKHFSKYKSIKKKITEYDPKYFGENGYQYNLQQIHYSLIKYFTRLEQIDSTRFYINKLDKNNVYADNINKKKYYEALSNFNKLKKNKELFYTYKDSLNNTNIKISKQQTINNIDLEERVNTFKELIKKKREINYWKYPLILILILLVGTTLFLINVNKKISEQKKIKEKQLTSLSKKISNQNKINLKIQESQNFINEVKIELKDITKTDNPLNKKNKIQDLFIKTHHKSSIDKFEGSYEQLYLLNPSFFDKLKEEYPMLNESELIVCYYINIDYKNNEIASLQKKSIRSIESICYRIRKKMIINNKKTTIKEVVKQIISI